DHLGNIRLSYSDTDGSNSINPNLEIVEENNYYPFGLKHKGYNNNVSANVNSAARKFMFGGKEYGEELGLDWYDISARNYNPALGRWMNIDPLAEAMRSQSTYNYAWNNPIYLIDEDGNTPSKPDDVITTATNTQRVGNKIKRDVKMTVTLTVVNLTGADLSDTMFSKSSGKIRLNNFEGRAESYTAGNDTHTIDNITEFNIEYNVVNSLDDVSDENSHVMMIVDNIPDNEDSSPVGLATLSGRISTVEEGTISNDTFDEVAQHELGHNLSLEHSDLKDLMFKEVNGSVGLSKKKKGDIVTRQLGPKDGDGTYKESISSSFFYNTNKLPKAKKTIKERANNFLKKNNITY
uniref:RHS repeat domain-containing protein n=1 Tax=uncultured Psychroserpens sp. TaxID=255436 RepID=UPI00260CDDA3